ncbi:MAG TPA: ArsR family transcriptional regulator [Nitrospirae bacterium]|nr:cadmium resistance transcriptional regulatory protein CadC [bacterium BMS3Bbin08]HDH51698.1 ArsR family transcriptional regulator [Nitrospirota bacterium]HDK17552.1 ArsR family transcriptional regulator [Nitrospirota bacterium]HDO26259.1 ArsR family transcriptional regulator [Nitrospirota bacterium]
MKRSYRHSSIDWTMKLKALADESRLKIIRELLKHDASVSNLSKALDIKIYNISRHLKILETCGLVNKRKEGNSRIYSLSDIVKRSYSSRHQTLDLGCCKFMFNELKK